MRGGPHSLVQLAEVNALDDEFGQQKASNGPIDAYREAVLQVEKENRKFSACVKALKEQVKERGEMVRRIVDGHVKDLLTQIDEIESDTMKETTSLTETLNSALVAALLSDAGGAQPLEVALNRHVEELVNICIKANCYSAPGVEFIAKDIDELSGDGKNTVGSVLKTTDRGK